MWEPPTETRRVGEGKPDTHAGRRNNRKIPSSLPNFVPMIRDEGGEP